MLTGARIGVLNHMQKGDQMRQIWQLDENGCGIACIAMLAGIGYRQAKRELYAGTSRRTSTFTDTRDLRRVLKRFGFKTSGHLRSLRGRQLIDLRSDAILKVNPRPDGSWHWVIWDATRKRILDPKGPRRGPYRYSSYLLVQPAGRSRP
ncbi:MAG: cysteine peptidase family C39 domain-containing protein [Alphaproteobacteria bacterium]